MCGSGAKFKANSDVEKYSGASGGGVEKQSGAIDGEGRTEPSSKVGSFSIFLGKLRCVKLATRRRVCQIPNCNSYQQFGKVFRLKRQCSPRSCFFQCENDF